MHFIKTAVDFVLNKLHLENEKSRPKSNASVLAGGGTYDPLDLIEPSCVTTDLKGETKEAIITELVGLLETEGKLANRDMVLADVLQRERTMSTGMQHGIALPHAKSEGVKAMCVAVGVKKTGMDFESIDGELSYLFVLLVSPKKISGPHIQFLASVGAILKDAATRERIMRAENAEEIVACLRAKHPA
jgi:mannitol/fructose-specific phosphotransferase system IIA component (Ntr-type)